MYPKLILRIAHVLCFYLDPLLEENNPGRLLDLDALRAQNKQFETIHEGWDFLYGLIAESVSRGHNFYQLLNRLPILYSREVETRFKYTKPEELAELLAKYFRLNPREKILRAIHPGQVL